MKLISNSKVGWPECLIGQIDPKELVPIVDVSLCIFASQCTSSFFPNCEGIIVNLSNIASSLRSGPMCNVIKREE